MSVPNTSGGWGLNTVRTEIGLGPTVSLQGDCFDNANPSGFDPTYEGSKDRLSNFRNYNHSPTPTLVAISLGQNTTSATSCSSYPNTTKYRNGANWGAASVLYNDSGGTTLAGANYYSDGVLWRYWNGTTFTMSSGC